VKLKPPGKRAIRGLAVTGVALFSVAGLALAQTPAHADPSVRYVMTGSDTIQDVMNAFAGSLGNNDIGSENATNPSTNVIGDPVTVAKTGISNLVNGSGTVVSANSVPASVCYFTRPDGSGQGNGALRQSMSALTTSGAPSTTTYATPSGESITLTGTNSSNATDTVTGDLPSVAPESGCVDIARSSSGPSTSNPDVVAPTNGLLQYIPFALDAVTVAIGSSAGTIVHPASTNLSGTEATPATNLAPGGVAPNFSLAQLEAMYDNATPETAANNGITYAPVVPGGSTPGGDTPIDLYIPQKGSGTLTFFAGKLNFSATNPPNFDYQTIQSDGGQTVSDWVGQQVEEHDGTDVTVDPNGLTPFSIAQYIAQSHGIDPRIHQAVLLQIGGTSPTSTVANQTTPTNVGTLNTGFPLTREVYLVIPYDKAVNTGDGNYDPTMAALIVGSSSTLCHDSLLIAQYGFGLLTSSPLGHTCGAVDTTNLRAYDAAEW